MRSQSSEISGQQGWRHVCLLTSALCLLASALHAGVPLPVLARRAATAATGTNIVPAPTAWWRFETNGLDSVSTNYLSTNGTPTYLEATGPDGSTAVLLTESDGAWFENVHGPNFSASNAFTLTAWINANPDSIGGFWLLGKTQTNLHAAGFSFTALGDQLTASMPAPQYTNACTNGSSVLVTPQGSASWTVTVAGYVPVQEGTVEVRYAASSGTPFGEPYLVAASQMFDPTTLTVTADTGPGGTIATYVNRAQPSTNLTYPADEWFFVALSFSTNGGFTLTLNATTTTNTGSSSGFTNSTANLVFGRDPVAELISTFALDEAGWWKATNLSAAELNWLWNQGTPRTFHDGAWH